MANALQAFDCFVTNVDKVGPLLKISGQVDRQSSCLVEKILLNLYKRFEENVQPVQPEDLTPGLLCCAKYKDGSYYRAHINGVCSTAPGTVEVRFIDYGNVELISLENIRLMDEYSARLSLVEPQASEFILAGVVHRYSEWTPQCLEQVLQEIAYVELKCVLVSVVQSVKLVKVIHQSADLSEGLIRKGLARPCSFDEQELLLGSLAAQAARPAMARPIPPPAPQHELCSYKSVLLEPGSEHMVYVSYVEDGPLVFSVQLQSMEEALERLMGEVNKVVLQPVIEPPVPGLPCLARCLEDGSLCRAVVTNVVADECKTYYVDFGNTDNLPLSHIFQIPFKYVLPKVMSMRFTLGGARGLQLDERAKCAFKDFVSNKLLRLRVLHAQGSPVLQHCELFDGEHSVLHVLYDTARGYAAVPVHKAAKYAVIVSFIQGCRRFFVQLKESSAALSSLMVALAAAATQQPVVRPADVRAGLVCSALYAADQQWYRAQVTAVHATAATVKYVDYGNEDTVPLDRLRHLDAQFVDMLPAQAIECCLYGYQNMQFNSEIESVFESLTLECEFSMMVVSKQASGVLLVDLFDSAANNVAALLIEQLAAKQSHMPGLPAHHIANELLKSKGGGGDAPDSPGSDSKPPWRSPDDKQPPPPAQLAQPLRSPDDKQQSWRGAKDDPHKSWRSAGKPNNEKIENKDFNNKKPFTDLPSNKRSFGDSPPSRKNFDNSPPNVKNFGDPPSSNMYSDNMPARKPYDNRRKYEEYPNKKPYENSYSNRKTYDESESNVKSFEDSQPRKPYEDRKRHFDDGQNRPPFGGPKKFGDRPNRKPFGDSEFKDRPNRKPFGDSEFKDRNFERKPYQKKTVDRKPFDETQKKSYDSDSSNASENRFKKKFDRFNDNKFPTKDNRNYDRTNKPAYQGNEKSFNNRFDKSLGTKSNFAPKNNIRSPEHKKLPPQVLASFSQPFKYLEIAPGASESVAISWFYNPEDFYCQLLGHQNEFRSMMSEIQTAYDGRPPYSNVVEVGSSVVAEFTEDKILYRAIVLEAKQKKYKVQYIDFGNVAVIDDNKVWQVETKFMDMPMQAVRCGIVNLKPNGDVWPNDEIIDKIFNKDSFVCVFDSFVVDRYGIQLSHNDSNIKQQLLDTGLAVESNVAFSMADVQIDMNLLLGQYLHVRVTHVDDLNKFFVHLNKQKADTTLQKLEEFFTVLDQATLQALTLEQLYEGLTCLIKSRDNKWYRGLIAKVNETQIDVSFADFGRIESLPINQLYALPVELYGYWYQAYECTLHNYSENVTVLDSNFKDNYVNQDLLIYINEVDNNRLVVTLYDLGGVKLELIDPDEGAFPTIEPICPLPMYNSDQSVWVSHVEDINSVYIQLNTYTQMLSELLENLYNFYNEGGETIELSAGSYCAVKSENDENWYRAKIKDFTDDSVNVFYIDYGNCESVPKQNVKKLDKSFYFPHKLSLNARLGLKELSGEAVVKLTELTADKTLLANVTFDEIGWIVCLYDGETNINQTLIDLQLASYQDAVMIEPIAEEETEPVHTDHKTKISITHVDSPSEFYVQLVDNEDAINNLQLDLKSRIDTFTDLDGADIGVLCAARYSVDEEWYRAEVLDADADIITVRFVDYGNTDVINNESGKIKTLPADLLAVDKYARKCSLNVVSTKGEEWPQEAQKIFENAIEEGDTYADIVYQDGRNKTYVELYASGKNVAELLTDANLATHITRDVEDKIANNTGFVSHLNSVSEFWIQLESSVYDLEMICDRLANSDEFPDLQDLSPGILCAANYPDDEMWYRARILSNTDVGIEVLFVDYGNSSTAVKLKVLPEDLVHMPMLAQKCSLAKQPQVQKWSDKATEKFRELSAEGVTVFTVKKLAAGETSIVELFIDGVNIAEQLSELCGTEPEEARPSPIGQPDYVKAFVAHTKSLNEIYVHLDSDTEKLENMLQSLENTDSFAAVDEPKIGDVYAVYAEEDSLWYRGKILSIGEIHEVLLIDYGNVIRVTTLKKLPEELESIPSLATLCSLDLPDGVTEWDQSAQSKFQKICNDPASETGFSVEFLNNESVHKVRFFIDNRNIAEEISNELQALTLEEVLNIETSPADTDAHTVTEDKQVDDSTVLTNTPLQDSPKDDNSADLMLSIDNRLLTNTLDNPQEVNPGTSLDCDIKNSLTNSNTQDKSEDDSNFNLDKNDDNPQNDNSEQIPAILDENPKDLSSNLSPENNTGIVPENSDPAESIIDENLEISENLEDCEFVSAIDVPEISDENSEQTAIFNENPKDLSSDIIPDNSTGKVPESLNPAESTISENPEVHEYLEDSKLVSESLTEIDEVPKRSDKNSEETPVNFNENIENPKDLNSELILENSGNLNPVESIIPENLEICENSEDSKLIPESSTVNVEVPESSDSLDENPEQSPANLIENPLILTDNAKVLDSSTTAKSITSENPANLIETNENITDSDAKCILSNDDEVNHAPSDSVSAVSDQNESVTNDADFDQEISIQNVLSSDTTDSTELTADSILEPDMSDGETKACVGSPDFDSKSIEETSRPKTPEEKIFPGSINRGINND